MGSVTSYASGEIAAAVGAKGVFARDDYGFGGVDAVSRRKAGLRKTRISESCCVEVVALAGVATDALAEVVLAVRTLRNSTRTDALSRVVHP